MTRLYKYVLPFALLALSACQTSVPTVPATPVTQAWLGKWTGPEGTYLILDQHQGGYDLYIKDLDGVTTYAATPGIDSVRFERDGKPFIIRHGNGDATGMKWLAGKMDCLIVQPGEGYCRN